LSLKEDSELTLEIGQ